MRYRLEVRCSSEDRVLGTFEIEDLEQAAKEYAGSRGFEKRVMLDDQEEEAPGMPGQPHGLGGFWKSLGGGRMETEFSMPPDQTCSRFSYLQLVATPV